jgi:2-polyprenyl-3-methyl-5-hydroxy-6-metoxy-1,4-benzoquinol methylase
MNIGAANRRFERMIGIYNARQENEYHLPMEAKTYYETKFRAKDKINELNLKLIDLVKSYDPQSVLDFGCGTGKNLALLPDKITRFGIDISPANVKVAVDKHKLNVYWADESLLNHLTNFDVCFTCSVLDHIEDAYPVIQQLKRIANTAVIIAETNDQVGEFYFPHDYELYGFTKVPGYSFNGWAGAVYQT